jgi:hypothetical protein
MDSVVNTMSTPAAARLETRFQGIADAWLQGLALELGSAPSLHSIVPSGSDDMGRLWAATRVVALFLIALFVVAVGGSPLAHACEACERVPLAPEKPSDVPRHLGRLDVTVAVDTATSFVIERVRTWRWLSRWGVARGEVDIAQLDGEPDGLADISDGSDVMRAAGGYVAAYDAMEPQQPVRMPGFRREHNWALTYRSDAADAISQPAQSDRFPGMNTTLDDSVVVGLRFEWDYGWTR